MYETKFQRALDEERHRQVPNPIFNLMDINTYMLASKGSIS